MGDYLIGIDIGTQGTKAAVFDTKMKLIETAFEKSKLVTPEPGTVWQQPDDLYGSCARTIRELLEKSGIMGNEIAAVGIDGQMAGIMGIDKDGEASTPYDSWLDVRSKDYVDLLRRKAGDELIASSGGQTTCNHASKILWLKETDPAAYKNTAKFVLPHGYITGKMTGRKADDAVFDYTCLHFNSFSDNRNKKWNTDILRRFDVDEEKMPRVASPFEVIGTVTSEFAAISDLAEGVPVVAGAGDTASSTFGSGMFQKNRIEDCAGTASTLCCVVDQYVPDEKYKTLTMMRSPIDGLWLPLAYINGGGMCLKWFRDEMTGEDKLSFGDLEMKALQVPSGCEGLRFCPHFSGRVLPEDAKMKGSFIGLDFRHTAGHMYRAIMEGIAFEYHEYLEIIKENYPEASFEDMISIGGGSVSTLFNQIKANVLNLNVHTYENCETALIGSAVIAGYGAGIFDDCRTPISRVMKETKVFHPDAQINERYCEYSKEYDKMLTALHTYYHSI